MKSFLSLICMVLLMVACSKNGAPADISNVVADKEVNHTARYLAYQHTVNLEIEEEKIAGIFSTMITTCHDLPNSHCTVMESKLNSGRYGFAMIQFRAKPEEIKKLTTSLRQQGEIIDQSTTAEDLSAPIEDNAKKLAMLLDYRSKLEALRARANNDVESLIKVNHELAQVQSELEDMEGKKALMMQRVQTEILTVNISAHGQGSFWKPVRLAIADFGVNLSQGLSMAITACAYLLPWILFILVFVWGVRKLWRRRKPQQ